MILSTQAFIVITISGLAHTSPQVQECFLPEENRYANEHDLSKRIFAVNLSNEWERPVLNKDDPVKVSIDLNMRGIYEIDEKYQQVALAGNILIEWKDEIHVWANDSRFSCMDHIVMPWGPKTGLWIPDLAFTDADDKFLLTRAPDEQLRIAKDGTTSMNSGSMLVFRCTIDLSFFPFDVQTCPLVFETWRYTADYEVLTASTFTKSQIYKENDQWTLLSLHSAIENVSFSDGDVYPRVTFFIKMQRKARYYLLSVVLPCMLVVAVEVATFATPHDKPLRLEVSFTSMLAFSVFQSTVIRDLPRSADRPPLLLIFISVVTILIACAIFGQSISFYFAAKAKQCSKGDPHTKPAPRSLLILCNCMAHVVRIKPYDVADLRKKKIAAAGDDETAAEEGQIPPENKARSWQFVARVVDRQSFLLFVSILVATLLGFLAIAPLLAH